MSSCVCDGVFLVFRKILLFIIGVNMNAEARNKQPHSHHAHTLHIEVRHSMHIFSSTYLCITYINIEMTLMAIQIYLLCFAIVYGTAHSHKYISIRQIYKMCHVQFDVFQLFNIVLIIIIISFYFPAFINLYDESMRKLYFVLQYALWVRGGGEKRERVRQLKSVFV